MKQKFILIFFVCSCLYTYGQQSKELLLEARKKVEGVWVGVAGNDSVYLYLEQAFTEPDKLRGVDSIAPIYGWHKISTNGKILEESFSSRGKLQNNGYSIGSGYKKSKNQLYIVINDITRNRPLGGDFILKEDNSAVLKTWLLETWRNDGKEYPDGQTFPKEVRLVRISTSIKSI